jgi:hypothetical protein
MLFCYIFVITFCDKLLFDCHATLLARRFPPEHEECNKMGVEEILTWLTSKAHLTIQKLTKSSSAQVSEIRFHANVTFLTTVFFVHTHIWLSINVCATLLHRRLQHSKKKGKRTFYFYKLNLMY